MEINTLYTITFDTDETILAATLASSNELVMLMNTGNVIQYNIGNHKYQYLFSVESQLAYPGGGFDITANSTIYTLDEIVVLVNDYKQHGYIHYPPKYRSLHLWREDYHTDISCYPISLFRNEKDVPHIIYGVAWNHLQIMNLDTRQILTAAKSLIEENAEDKHIEFYKNHSEENKLPWPRPYDYFFGKLHLSPNKKKFLSTDWAWGSSDAYKVFNIEHFIESNRIADIGIGGWEHENRAVCWVNDEIVAIAYHPFTEGDDGATVESPFEIHFYKLVAERAEIEKKIQVGNMDVISATMIYEQKLDSIIIFSDKIGLAIISLDGQILLQDTTLKIDEYRMETGLLLKTEKKTVSVYEFKA